jgi:hypothetical protein
MAFDCPGPYPGTGERHLARRVDRIERAGGHCLAVIRLASVVRRLLLIGPRLGLTLDTRPAKNPLFASFSGQISGWVVRKFVYREGQCRLALKSLRRRPVGCLRVIVTPQLPSKMQPHPTRERGAGQLHRPRFSPTPWKKTKRGGGA